ncbi:MAG: fatty acid desaturase [Bacteroidia bacterium]|nr:fatty acid desaturase [Bacteroidia bacterium]MDW8158467.1 fatty acid desaturase [Bacteroidia bacterium]
MLITDPTFVAGKPYSSMERWLLQWINDERDLPFLRLCAILFFTTIPFAIYLYISQPFYWWVAALYFIYNNALWLGPFVLMLHNTSHRALFKRKYNFLNYFIPWVLGPFFGETPESYYAHHIGMHHPENNLKDDLSSTMAYQRDSLVDFFRYFFNFFFLGVWELSTYLRRKKRKKLLYRFWKGEFSFYIFVTLLCFVNWKATLVVFIIPFIFTRFMMMAGNWAQHAFIDPQSPNNCYRNSITCINTLYNRRCFNDGYHIGHHLKPTMHWTELPLEFQKNIKVYAQEGAIVFHTIDFFIIWLLLMLKRYDWLARFYVNLQPSVILSKEEIIELLKMRTARCV